MKSFAQPSSLALAAILLAACGDDITEQVTVNANVGAVKNSDDLPACTEDIAGQTAYIKETHEFLGCDGSEWQSLGASTVSVGDNVCMSKSLSDDSGFEIFCNGESIGTVRNGEKGEPGEKGADGQKGDKGDKGDDGAPGAKGDDGAKGDPGDPGKNGTNGTNGTSCSITESTALTATIACGSETFTMDLTGYVEQPAECDASLYEDCTGPVDNVELSGVSQKGPFVTGTDITAYELENGRSLKQTGKTFGGKIEREDGTFDIKTVKLKSTFAYLVADGFYRNEVTGENSAATIKLRALTNLQGRTNANINLVTHLEYDRVQRLVTKEDSSVLMAKRAAEKEIFAAFGIDNTDFKGFAEDFNILEAGDGNAALLAISALLQGDRNESELTALLAALSVDLGDDGKWGDKKQRAQVADWAMKKDLEGGLATIRKNIKGWKLRDSEPPAFEGYFSNFWMTELGVEKCTAENSGTVFAVKNKNSAYYAANDLVFTEGDNSLERLICDASGTSPAWRFATDLEKDTLAFAAAGEGTVKRGSVDTANIYVKEGKWRRGTELDVSLDFACVANKDGAVNTRIVDGEIKWFICDAKIVVIDGESVPPAWRVATTAEADTAGFGTPDGEVARIGNVNKSLVYVFEDTSNTGVGVWRYGTTMDLVPGLGPCTKEKLDSILYASNDKGAAGWYKCASDKFVFVNGVQIPYAWRESSAFEKDMPYWESKQDTAAGTLLEGEYSKMTMVWDDSTLREASKYEKMLKKGCIASMYWTRDSLSNGLTYTCDESGWSKTGTFVDHRGLHGMPTYKAVQIGNQVWMAENLNYADYFPYSGEVEYGYPRTDSMSFCIGNDPANCEKYGRLYLWSAAMDSAGSVPGNTANNCGFGSTCSPTGTVRGVCPMGWHLPTKAEWDTLFAAIGDTLKAGMSLKSTSGWNKNGDGTDAFGFSVLPVGNIFAGYFYLEGEGAYFWSATEDGGENAYFMSLNYDRENALLDSYSKGYGMSVRCVRDAIPDDD